jgi:ectoine hydroxylase-related dioxygenase (phytanoyl-CoA dioxygenase family)
MSCLRREVALGGFSLRHNFVDPAHVSALLSALDAVGPGLSVRRRSGVYAIRNLLTLSPAIQDLAHDDKVLRVVRDILGPDARAVKATLFDKTPAANWRVPWHQDLTISVNTRISHKGYGPWTTKAGVTHVQPPVEILERMLAVRIHLDDCAADNGALRVLPGTHHRGRLSSSEIAVIRRNIKPVICAAPSGGAVLMRPLILHASSPSSTPGHRRVIHFDFAAIDLPSGLSWCTEAHG